METTNKNQIEREVLTAFEGLVQTSKSLDPEQYFQYFDKENFTGLNADGTVWLSIEPFEVLIRAGFPAIEKINHLEFNNVKVTVINSTTAILVNEYTENILLKSGDSVSQSGGGTQVWSKSAHGWKLVSVSASNAR